VYYTLWWRLTLIGFCLLLAVPRSHAAVPATLVKFGYTNAFQAFGSGGVDLIVVEYMKKVFVPTLDTTGRTVNGSAVRPIT